MEMLTLEGLGEFFDIYMLVSFIVIIVITVFMERIIRGILKRAFEHSSKIMKSDPTNFLIVRNIISLGIYIVGLSLAIYSVPALRFLTYSLLAGAGILAVVIGFASQQAFSNIISGVFLAIFKPFKVGDMIRFGDKGGVVEDITLRHTVVRNFENRRFVVPNSKISDETIENSNLTDEKTCRFVEIGISYDSDINKAMKIMEKEALKHPETIDNRSTEDKKNGLPQVAVRVMGFSDSSVNLRASVWGANPPAAFRIGTDLNKSIKERFDKEGIEIPFPYRTIVYKKDIKKKPVKKSAKSK